MFKKIFLRIFGIVFFMGFVVVNSFAAYPTNSMVLVFSNGLNSDDTGNWQKANWQFNDITDFDPAQISFSSGLMDITLISNSPRNKGGEYRTKYDHYGSVDLKYGLYIVRMKPQTVTGTVSSFFLYGRAGTNVGDSPDGHWHEIDIEFLGKDSTSNVHFNDHYDDDNIVSNGHSENPLTCNLGFNPTTAFHEYAILWITNRIQFYVDGHLVEDRTPVGPHNYPMKLMLNHWADNSGWAGSFDSNNLPSEVQYDYIKFYQLTNNTLLPATNSAVIDTFEDGDMYDNNGGLWQAVNDSANSGNSTASIKLTNDSFEGTNAIYFKYTLGADYQYRYAFLDDAYGTIKDYSKFSNISFAIKGSGHQMRIVLATTNITNYNYYGYTLSATPSTWTTYTLSFSDFAQEDWGSATDPKPLRLDYLKEFQFKASSQNSGENGWFIIDNVKVGRSTFSAPVISSLTATEDTNGSGKVIINYTGTDAENDTCTYTNAEYSTNNSTWYAMTVASNDTRHNSEPLGFTSSGASLNYVWDSKANLGAIYDGTVWVRLQVNDGTSNSSIVSSSSFVVDNENPTIPSLSTPASNSVGNNTAVTFTWNASSDGSGIDHYVIEVSTNSAFGSIEKSSNTGTNSASLTLSEGTNYWRVRACDVYGNVSANSVVWTLTIDTNQIIPHLHSPANNTLSSVAKPTFTWSQEPGISSNQIVITTNGVAINITLSSNETNYSVTNFALPEGTNSWKVRVKTSTGWQAFSASYTYIVDTTAPTNVPNISIENGATTTTNKEVTITLKITNLDSDVVGYYISEENTPPPANSGWNMGSIPTNVVFTLSSGEGTKTVSIWVIDSVGNISAPRSDSITYKIATSGLPKNTFTVIPNPLFKDEIMDITYGADAGAEVKFEVYTMVGSLVKTIQPNTSTQTAIWDGKNSDGKEVASGIYLMIMRVNDKMVYHPIKVGYIGRKR